VRWRVRWRQRGAGDGRVAWTGRAIALRLGEAGTTAAVQSDNHLLIDRIWPGDLRPDGSALNGALIIRKWEMAMFADGLACRVPSAYEPGGRFGASRLDPLDL